MKPRAVIFDLDGTLTPSKQPLESAMGVTLAKLLTKLPVAVFSGAALHQFERQFLAFLPKDAKLENLYLFPTSAAQCYRYRDGAWHAEYAHNFTPEEKGKIMANLKEGIEKTKIVDDSTPQWGERIEDRGAQITFSALGQQAPLEAKRAWDPDRTKRTPLRDFLLKRLPDYNYGMNAYNSLDITHPGINKAYGVGEFSKMVDIPVPELLYVGDALFPGGNDAIVIPTGIPTRQVSGPDETAAVIREFTSPA